MIVVTREKMKIVPNFSKRPSADVKELSAGGAGNEASFPYPDTISRDSQPNNGKEEANLQKHIAPVKDQSYYHMIGLFI